RRGCAPHAPAARLVAGVDALRGRHQVRLDPEGLAAEPPAGAAESADHLVRDQQDPVFAADALDLRPVAGRRDDHAARALDRFADEGRDPPGPDFLVYLLGPALGPEAGALAMNFGGVL